MLRIPAVLDRSGKPDVEASIVAALYHLFFVKKDSTIEDLEKVVVIIGRYSEYREYRDEEAVGKSHQPSSS